MASWKYDGKIAGNFPWGAVNFDVKKIIFADSTHTYSQDGDETNAVNKIYYIPAGVIPTQANLESFRIWHRYQVNDLVSGTQTVCIEYVPTEDVQLSSLAIFTHDAESSRTVNFGIIHESGLVVYLSDEDYVSDLMTKYNLSGYRRYKSSISGITLKKGLKYYIQWTNTNNTFKPAYFENTAGNYLDWSHGSLQDKSVANLNSAKTYLGVVSDAATWLAAQENDLMICGNNIDSLNNTDAYIRNGLINGATVIGQSGQTLPAVEKDKILSLNAGDGFMYIGNNYTENNVAIVENQHIYAKNNQLDNSKYKGIKTTAKGILDDLDIDDYCIYSGSSVAGGLIQDNHIYQKTADIDVKEEYQCTGSNMTDALSILDLSYNAGGNNKAVATNGYLWWSDITGNVYTLKSGYVPKLNKQSGSFVGFAPSDITTGSAGDLFYITAQGHVPLTNQDLYNFGLYYYDGNSLTFYCDGNNKDRYESLFTIVSMSNAVQEIMLAGKVDVVGTTGRLSELVKTHYDGHYISNNLRQQTIQTDKKFYLEINGTEV